MAKRIYLVTPTAPLTIATKEQKPRLIRATIGGQALRHATKDLYTVEVANQNQIVENLTAGCKVEEATEE